MVPYPGMLLCVVATMSWCLHCASKKWGGRANKAEFSARGTFRLACSAEVSRQMAPQAHRAANSAELKLNESAGPQSAEAQVRLNLGISDSPNVHSSPETGYSFAFGVRGGWGLFSLHN